MVGLNGLEPSTSRLSGVRSNHLSYRPTYGGGKEIRTPDPLRARQVLSQLSYTPIFNRCSHNAYYFIKKLFRSFAYMTITFCGATFQLSSTRISKYLWTVRNPKSKLLVWALSVSLAATQKIDVSFSSSGYLDVSVPRVTFLKLWIHLRIHEVSHVGFPIRKSVDHGLCAATHSLSQLITSFIGS